MKTWNFYDPATGALHRRKYGGPERDLADNVPAGMQPIEGDFDPLSQRVDLETLNVVDYQPPAPDADHEWNAATRRWLRRSDVAAREARDQAARRRIEQLEQAQWRPTRELAIDPQNATAATKLREIDAEITALRAELSARQH